MIQFPYTLWGQGMWKVNSYRQDDGYFLIDLIVAITVLALCLHGLMYLTVNSTKENNVSGKMTAATVLAQNHIELLKTQSFSNLDTYDKTEDYQTITDYQNFKRITKITSVNDGAEVKDITVQIFWNGDKDSLVFRTILSNTGQ